MNPRLIWYVPVGLLTALLLTFAVYQSSLSAATDTCTWTGAGGNANINNGGNWTGCDNSGVPEVGDALIFPNGPTNKTVLINLNIEFASITFSGDGYTVNTTDASFYQLFVINSLTISGNNNTFNAPIRFYPATESTFTHSGNNTDIAVGLVVQPSVSGANLVFDIESDLGLKTIGHAGSETLGDVYKTGAGTLSIVGAALTGLNVTGSIQISDGTWQCGDTINCLGPSSNEVIIEEGGGTEAAVLKLDGAGTIAHPLIIATTSGDPGVIHATANVTLTGGITLFTDGVLQADSGRTMTVNSNVSVTSGQTLFHAGIGSVVHGGVISGAGNLDIDDAHVSLSGANTYGGTTTLHGGALVTIANEDSLGSTLVGTTVNTGATLEFNNNYDMLIAEPLSIAGQGRGGGYDGALVKSDQYAGLTGGIVLIGNATLVNKAVEFFSLSGQVTGAYNLNLVGGVSNGNYLMETSTANTYSSTTVTGAQLVLNSPDGIVTIPGDITVNAVDGFSSRVRANNDELIANSSIVTLNNDTTEPAAFNIYVAATETVGTVQGDGDIEFSDPDGQLNLSGSVNGVFSGVVKGASGALIHLTNGTWTFSGTNTEVASGFGYASYYINGGTFIANAADTSLSLSPFSISDGTIGGTGTIGPVSVYSGTIAPGNSPGCLNISGDIAFTDEFSHYNIELDGTTACTGYDQLSATGIVYLNGATLDSIDLGFVPATGDTFTIIQAAGINGTFVGLANNDIFTVNGRTFQITYGATDVTLTDVTASNGVSATDGQLADTGTSIIDVVIAALILILLGYLLLRNSSILPSHKAASKIQ